MAQWDVYPNPVVRARDEIPYLVVLQSDLLDALPTRLVAPLWLHWPESAASPLD